MSIWREEAQVNPEHLHGQLSQSINYYFFGFDSHVRIILYILYYTWICLEMFSATTISNLKWSVSFIDIKEDYKVVSMNACYCSILLCIRKISTLRVCFVSLNLITQWMLGKDTKTNNVWHCQVKDLQHYLILLASSFIRFLLTCFCSFTLIDFRQWACWANVFTLTQFQI